MHSQLVHSHPIPNTSQFAQFVVHDSQRPISMVQPPHALPEQPQDAAYATLTPVWSSQDSVDSLSPRFVSGFELFRAYAS